MWMDRKRGSKKLHLISQKYFQIGEYQRQQVKRFMTEAVII